jgi:formylglycine-generating enzyme required for sulfatase activity
VSWNDAQAFVRQLGQRTGKTYRLPTEAEWEYACRAGGQNEYCGGANIDRVAWYDKNSGGKPHGVAGKQPNAWGLYDMSGNVWEWVEDCWNDSYNGAPADASAWASGDCRKHVMRGGSWNTEILRFRATFRNFDDFNRFSFVGFRLARMLP